VVSGELNTGETATSKAKRTDSEVLRSRLLMGSKMAEEKETASKVSRREFVKGAAVGAAVAGAGALAGCAPAATPVSTVAPEAAPTCPPCPECEPCPAPEEASAPEKVSFETPPDPIPASEIKETLTADVVVAGGGAGGLCAAIAAAEAGAEVILLEKAGQPQCHGFGVESVNSRWAIENGQEEDKFEWIQERMFDRSGNRADQRLVTLYFEESGKTVDWLKDMAVKAGLASAESSTFTVPTLGFGMTGVAQFLVSAAEDHGVDVRFETPALQLVSSSDGRITGVIAQDLRGDYIQCNANKGVILCTGGYGCNPEMVEKYIPILKDGYFCNYKPVPYTPEPDVPMPSGTATGDGIKMGLWVGAEIDEIPHAANTFDQWIVDRPEFNEESLTRQAWLTVNLLGERFVNEDTEKNYQANAFLVQPGKRVWVVFDSKWPDDTARMNMQACEMMMSPFHDPEQVQELIDRDIIKSADTIEELAQKMDMPVETFKATVGRYNELARLGEDLDFGKRPECLTTIEEPPLYACKVGTALLVTGGGLKTNTKLQVLDPDREVIPGLYAAGNDAGGFFAKDWYGGTSIGRAATWGRLAGTNAATEA
jgi:fumarate reductase flavoprotein subunit